MLYASAAAPAFHQAWKNASEVSATAVRARQAAGSVASTAPTSRWDAWLATSIAGPRTPDRWSVPWRSRLTSARSSGRSAPV